MRNSNNRVLSFLNRFGANNKGATILIFALSLPVVVGFLGIGAEVVYWYANQRSMQTASDFGAFTAAVELRAAKTESLAKIQGKYEALQNGGDTTRDTITVNIPPLSGTNLSATAAEMIIVRQVPRLFSSLFINGTMQITTRAVAQFEQGGAVCILALDPEERGAINFTGTADLKLVDCDVHSNSNDDQSVIVTGAADVEGCLSGSGLVDAKIVTDLATQNGVLLGDCTTFGEETPRAIDPLASLEVPDVSGEPCLSDPDAVLTLANGGIDTYAAGRYCDGIAFNKEAIMEPGIFYIEGNAPGFSATSKADVTGIGVTIVTTNGADVDIRGGAVMNLSAPGAEGGDFEGVLFYGDRNEPDTKNIINGNSLTSFSGAVYFPSQELIFNGNSTSGTGCMQLIARIITISGTADIGSNCTVGNSFVQARSPGYVRLVE